MAGNKIAAISIIKLQSDISDVSKDLKILKARSTSTAGSINKLGKALGGLAAASAIIGTLKQLGGALIDNARRFEKYEAMLKVATGSAEEAVKQFDRIKQFAIDTPFTVDELTKSFVLLNNRGMKPSNKQMTAMADLAASLGRTFEDMSMAALRASSGETERMRNMGIEASVQGDKIKLSFKGVTKVVDRNIVSIVELLEEFGQLDGVLGTSQEIMGTMEGKLSNLSDAWDLLRDAINKTTSEPMKATIQHWIDIMGGITRWLNPTKVQAAEDAYNGLAIAMAKAFEAQDGTGEMGANRGASSLIADLQRDGVDVTGINSYTTAWQKALEVLSGYRIELTAAKKEMADLDAASGSTNGNDGVGDKQKIKLFDFTGEARDEAAMFKEIFAEEAEIQEMNEALKELSDLYGFFMDQLKPERFDAMVPEDLPEKLGLIKDKLEEISFIGTIMEDALKGLVDNMSQFLIAMADGSENAAEKFKKALLGSLGAVIAKLLVAIALAGVLAVLANIGTFGASGAVGGMSMTGGFASILKQLMGVAGKASGGFGTGLTMVGENGAEMVSLGGGGRVLSRGDMMNALSGNNSNDGHVEYVIGNDALEGTLKRGRAKKNLL